MWKNILDIDRRILDLAGPLVVVLALPLARLIHADDGRWLIAAA